MRGNSCFTEVYIMAAGLSAGSDRVNPLFMLSKNRILYHLSFYISSWQENIISLVTGCVTAPFDLSDNYLSIPYIGLLLLLH